MENFKDLLPIILSSAVVYLFIVISIRLFGKKEFAQLSVSDLVFVLLISNAVQNAMVGSNSTLLGGLVAAATLFVVNYVFKYLMYRFPVFNTFISGEPRLLVYHGHIMEENLRRERISINELLETIREHGCRSVKEVDLAVLESDGNISILSNDFTHRSSQKRRHGRKGLTGTAGTPNGTKP